MNKQYPSNKIYVSQSQMPGAGRGVFAKGGIKKGEVIERCPVIIIPKYDAARVNESMLVTYIYYLGPKKDRLTLVLGFGSVYNHTDQPNALYTDKFKEKFIEFTAIKNIEKDEEITVNYSQGDQKDTSPLWFRV